MQEPSVRFGEIEKIIARDPGGRGIQHLLVPGDLESAARSVGKATEIVLATGFVVTGAEACETDGPPGAWVISRAVESLGIAVSFLLDSRTQSLFERAGIEEDMWKPAEGMQPVLIAVEVPARAADGRRYSMTGEDITSWNGSTDEAFLEATGPTIGIGDGGNEVGMGRVGHRVRQHVALGEVIASVVATDFVISAGVSNWGAWGLVAGLSIVTGRNLLPTRELATEDLNRFVAAGAVDGRTKKNEPTVDGLTLPEYLAALDGLHELVER